jgi:hypothetical protein
MIGLGLCALVGLAACSGTPAPPTATPTPIIRATLPPTWTPTPTPGITPTDRPTITPTAAPTLTRADVCDRFSVTRTFEDGTRFVHNAEIPLFFGVESFEVTVRFVATQRYTGENLGIEVPGGEMFGMSLAAARLPGHGLYDWRLSVVSPVDGELCARTGYFFVLPPPATEEATP